MPTAIESIIKKRYSYRGLTSKEAAENLIIHGPNTRPWKIERHWLKRFFDIVSEPMILLILATAGVYLFIGEKIEAIIFFLSVIPIGLIDYFQQRRTDRALSELSKMVEQFCKVYRNGVLITESVKNLVPGDLVYLTAGDKIPADGYLFSGTGLMVDESMLTGESVPATKRPMPDGEEVPGNGYKLFQGTLATSGAGEFLVVYTGIKTEYGHLGTLLEKIVKEKTPLQKKIRRLIRGVAIAAVFAALSVGTLLALWRGLKDGLLGGLTMGMSLIPEEFPIVFSVFLVMGVWRMAKKNALVRQMTTVETLGAATVICTDKTGTLTEGRMSFEKAFYQNRLIDARTDAGKSQLFELAKMAVLSLERVATDPLEVEMQRYTKDIGVDPEKVFDGHELIRDSAFDASTKMVHHLWREKSDGKCCLYSAGAPEAIIGLCGISQTEKENLLKINSDLAALGLRVIALAKKECACDDGISPEKAEFVALLAMSDPPRDRVSDAIHMCQEAGIRVLMVTGDNMLTARNVASRIGLKHNNEILDGDDISKMSPAALKKAVASHEIFARVRPEHKYLIVEALQANKEVVAMTGDGVNDAPALKKADIGIAMGRKGTEVAREAADMMLLDDDFFTIASAVKEGRKIYRNLQQAFAFLLSFHIPIVGLALLPLFFGEPLIFLPIHIIFLELICDPASVLGFEKEKAPRNIMSQPPRPVKEPLIPVPLWGQVTVQALSIFAVSFGFYFYFSRMAGNFELGRTLAFVSLVVSQTMLIFLTRDWYQIKNNWTLSGIGILTWAALTLIVYLPVLRPLFNMAEVKPVLYGLVYLVSFAVTGLAIFFFRLRTRKSYGRNT